MRMNTKALRIGLILIIVIILVAITIALIIPPVINTPYSIMIAPTRNRIEPVSITPTPRPTKVTPGNLISNPSFEGNYVNWGISVNVAPGWTPYSDPSNPPPCVAGTPGCDIPCPQNCIDTHPVEQCAVDWGCWYIKPEHKAATNQFPERVHTGEYAQQAFCFGAQCRGGVLQVIPVVDGSWLQFSTWVQNWQCFELNGCGGMSDNPPSGLMRARIGIDPFGGNSYTSTNIIWSGYNEGRDYYERLEIIVQAQAPQVTAFVEFSPRWPWGHYHNNVYIDDSALVRIYLTHTLGLPAIFRNYSAPTPTPQPTPTPGPTPISQLYSLAWWEPSQIEVGATDPYTAELYIYTSDRLGDIELVMASFVITDDIEIISIMPGSYLDAVERFTWNTSGNYLVIEALGYSIAGKSRPLAAVSMKGSGCIYPLADYSTFIGTSTGGGVTPETKRFCARGIGWKQTLLDSMR